MNIHEYGDNVFKLNRAILTSLICVIYLVACGDEKRSGVKGLSIADLEIRASIGMTNEETNVTVRFHYDSGDAIFNTILLESNDRVYLYADGVRYKLNEVESVPLFPYTTKRQYSYEGFTHRCGTSVSNGCAFDRYYRSPTSADYSTFGEYGNISYV